MRKNKKIKKRKRKKKKRKKKIVLVIQIKRGLYDVLLIPISVFLVASSLSANSANFTKPTESNNNVQSTINNNHFNHQQQSVSHQQIFSNFIAGQHHPQLHRNPLNMPKNEPVKLVYPTNNNTQSSTIVTMNNNRVTFSNAPVQNGTITLSPMTANQQGQQQMMQGANIKITGQQGGQQAPTLIFKNAISSAPGTFVTSSPVTMSKANNNQVNIFVYNK